MSQAGAKPSWLTLEGSAHPLGATWIAEEKAYNPRLQVSSVDEEPLSFVCTRSARMERAFFDARGEDITAPVLQHVRNEIDAALTKK